MTVPALSIQAQPEKMKEAEEKVDTAEAKASAALDAAMVHLGGAEPTPSQLDEADEGVKIAAEVVAETQQFLRKLMAEAALTGKSGAWTVGQQLQKMIQKLLPVASKLNAQKARIRSFKAGVGARDASDPSRGGRQQQHRGSPPRGSAHPSSPREGRTRRGLEVAQAGKWPQHRGTTPRGVAHASSPPLQAGGAESLLAPGHGRTRRQGKGHKKKKDLRRDRSQDTSPQRKRRR